MIGRDADFPLNEYVSRTACDLIATGCTSDAPLQGAAADRSSALARMRAAAKSPAYAAASALLSSRELGSFAPYDLPLAARLARLTDALRVEFLTCCRAAAAKNVAKSNLCSNNVRLLRKALSLPRPAAGAAVQSPVLAVVFGVVKSDVGYKISGDTAFNFNAKWHRPQLRVLVALANNGHPLPSGAVVGGSDPVVLAAYQETATGVKYKKRARGLRRVGETYLPALGGIPVILHSNAVPCDQFHRDNERARNRLGDQCGDIGHSNKCYCFAVRASRNRIKVMRVLVPEDRLAEFHEFIEKVQGRIGQDAPLDPAGQKLNQPPRNKKRSQSQRQLLLPNLIQQ